MAIGFLFLGGGLRTFGTNNGAVAALLIALYPRFPTTPNDHRCHLQVGSYIFMLRRTVCISSAWGCFGGPNNRKQRFELWVGCLVGRIILSIIWWFWIPSSWLLCVISTGSSWMFLFLIEWYLRVYYSRPTFVLFYQSFVRQLRSSFWISYLICQCCDMLQAFRHLYVLATEARCVQTVDVDTGLPVLVPLEMTVQNSGCQGETTITRFTPCILPERCSVRFSLSQLLE